MQRNKFLCAWPLQPIAHCFDDSHLSQSKIKIFAENLENNILYLRLIDYVKYFIWIHSCRFKSIELDIRSFNPGFIFESFDLILMSDFIQLDYFFEIFCRKRLSGLISIYGLLSSKLNWFFTQFIKNWEQQKRLIYILFCSQMGEKN